MSCCPSPVEESARRGPNPASQYRSAKRSSEVWEHYRLLAGEKQNVECVYCWKMLKRGDSSTKSMWGHLHALHADVLSGAAKRRREDEEQAEEQQQADATPTQPYVKRQRAGGLNHQMNQLHQMGAGGIELAMQQLQQKHIGEATNELLRQQAAASPFAFLDSIPKMDGVINIQAGFKEEEQEEEEQPGSSSGSPPADRVSSSPPEEQPGGSPSVSSTQHIGGLNAFINIAAANPLVWNAVSALTGQNPPTSSTPPTHGAAFSLNDGQCVAVLMKMAIDLDLTLSYHKRRGEIELSFESNRTAEKSGGRGKVLALSDMGREIRVTERVNGAASDTELWTKTDLNQLHWAIRGKCQKSLHKF